MRRNEWKFEYTGAKLAQGAADQLTHRQARVKVWSDRYDEIMATIKEKGLTVDEGNQRLGIASNNVGYTQVLGPQINVDTSLQRSLGEAFTKLNHHKQMAQQYEGWVQIFTANPEQTVKLNQDDWLYFFGKTN